MFNQVSIVSFVVKDINKAIDLYSNAFGLKLWGKGVVDVPEESVKVAMFNVGGTYIELMEPYDPRSIAGRLLKKRGEGFYSMSIVPDDIEQSLETLRKKGIEARRMDVKSLFRTPIWYYLVDLTDKTGIMLQLNPGEKDRAKER